MRHLALPRTRLTGVVGVVAIPALLVGGLVGCDKDVHEANKNVERLVSDAAVANNDAARIKLLEDAARFDAADPLFKIHAKDALGDAELAAGQAALADATRKAAQVSRAITEISRIAAHVHSANELVEALGQMDPAPVSDALNEQAARARGEGGSPTWVDHDDERVALPSLAKLQSQIQDVQRRIEEQKQQVDSTAQQAVAALSEAGELEERSLRAKGKESVDLYNQASARRKQAHDLQGRADELRDGLLPLERELALAEARRDRVTAALSALEETAKVVDDGWTAIQGESKVVSTTAAELVEGDEQALAGSAAQASNALAQATTEFHEAFEQATGHLDRAIKSYGDATTAAQAVAKTVQQRLGAQRGAKPAETAAVKGLAEAVAPETFRLQGATARHLKATLLGRHAVLLTERDRAVTDLSDALSRAGVAMPQGLVDPDLSARKAEAVEEAKRMFTEATTAFKELAESGGATETGKATQADASVGAMLAFYDFAQFTRSIGDDPAVANEYLSLARGSRTAAAEKNARIPPGTPPELLTAEAPAPAEGGVETPPAAEQPPADGQG